ncbi:MAG: Uncharacterised protein [Polaribacter sp. SA4-10]|nr:MAG: Uncharacterised protein [Polaribacter sp. SA4-10]
MAIFISDVKKKLTIFKLVALIGFKEVDFNEN